MRARFVNEELLGTYEGTYGNGEIEMYKNPPSIKRMGPWARALTDQNGNFYIASALKEEGRSTIATMHTDMIQWLKTHAQDVTTNWNGQKHRYDNGIAWQRYANTMKFYLSESYDEEWEIHLPYIKHFMETRDPFTPLGVKFELEIIDNIEDNSLSDIDQYHKMQAQLYR